MVTGQLEVKLRIIYTGVFVKDTEALIARWKGATLSEVYGHHLTLEFRPSKVSLPFGRDIDLKVIGVLDTDEVQALVICRESLGALHCKNEVPHITVACAKGIKPFASNAALEKGYKPIIPFYVRGKIGAFTDKGNFFGSGYLDR